MALALGLWAPGAGAATRERQHHSDVDGPVLVLDLQAGEVPAAEVKVLDGLMAASVARTLDDAGVADRHPLHTAAELRALADVEAARSVVGCDPEATSCLAELAGALGARYVVTGTIGKLGEHVVLQLSLLPRPTSTPCSATLRSPATPRPTAPCCGRMGPCTW